MTRQRWTQERIRRHPAARGFDVDELPSPEDLMLDEREAERRADARLALAQARLARELAEEEDTDR